MSDKSLPEPLYSCVICKDDYSWPASDLFWSEKLNGWCCGECWSDVDLHYDDEKLIDAGICLADELKQRANTEA